MCCVSYIDLRLQSWPIILGNNDAIIRKSSYCIMVLKCTLVNAFAILIGRFITWIRGLSILGFWRHSHPEDRMRSWRKMETKWTQRLLWGRVKNSVKWCHPREASPCPKNWQQLTHTKPPETFPGLETMLRKLNFLARFTTPCQSLGTSHIASRIIAAL